MGIYYTSSKDRKNHSRDAYLLLNHVLKTEYGISDAVVEKTQEGKPYISNHTELYISISHTEGYVMCAVHSFPVGIDLQQRREIKPSLIKKVCNEDELNSLDFFSLWSLKESYIKLRGKLTGGYKDIVFSAVGNPICMSDPSASAKIYDFLPGYSCCGCYYGKAIEENPIFILDIGRTV